MKKFLPNLLIVLALGLCGFNAFQWVREARLRAELQTLTDTVRNKMEAIQNLETAVKRSDAEITRLEGLRTDLTDTVKSNRVEILSLNRQGDKLERELDTAKKNVESYKEALEKANENIKHQNEDVKKQNADLKTVMDERNVIVEKFNKMAADYNELVGKWNKQQEELAKAAQAAQAAQAAAQAAASGGSGQPKK